jgi:hypothetical protein
MIFCQNEAQLRQNEMEIYHGRFTRNPRTTLRGDPER